MHTSNPPQPPHPSHSVDIAALSLNERIDLAQKLWDSVREEIEAAPLTPEQIAEVKKRIAAIEDGSVVCEPFDAVVHQLRGR